MLRVETDFVLDAMAKINVTLCIICLIIILISFGSELPFRLSLIFTALSRIPLNFDKVYDCCAFGFEHDTTAGNRYKGYKSIWELIFLHLERSILDFAAYFLSKRKLN
ncbi:uncharacterized protein EV154DRAFT_475702 [Mucor mucedo]|uniref:uncharacterized protein n=1 Tax=Mucor mucedo TaxID=29922 RepID=UPI0022210103|nr:uncharacterized protein EV154DRAFT_475702 [Mucor mucedo]KAI7897384.1 hypothetical protein EV154DRAFT_475702 [Mucor mucedo]